MASQNAEMNMSADGPAVDRRARLQTTIDSLIKLRSDVAVSYCKLAGVTAFDQRDLQTHKVDGKQLRSFCQIMVDYTAMGHFEVYQRIIEGQERRVAVKEASDEVYPAIAETTDFLVDFNDKYDAFEGSDEDMKMLSADLPRLGQIIAIRSELEDQILDALRQKK